MAAPNPMGTVVRIGRAIAGLEVQGRWPRRVDTLEMITSLVEPTKPAGFPLAFAVVRGVDHN